MAGKNATSRAGQIGAFAQAKNHVVTSGFANYPVYQDATATPVTSPVTLSSSPTTINVPGAAVSITILSAVACVVSDTNNNADGSFAIPVGVPVTIPLVTPSNDANDPTGQLFLSSSAGGACSFFFSCV